jgi:hypothetical protein
MKRVIGISVTAAALAVPLVAILPTAAEAAALSCGSASVYSTTGASSSWVGDAQRKVTGVGPMTLTITITRTDAVTGTFGGTGGFSVSGIIASAKAEVNSSIASTVTAGTTYSGAYTIPSGRHGWLQWGSWGYRYNWTYGHYSGCKWVVTKRGNAVSPTLSGKGFNHGLS